MKCILFVFVSSFWIPNSVCSRNTWRKLFLKNKIPHETLPKSSNALFRRQTSCFYVPRCQKPTMTLEWGDIVRVKWTISPFLWDTVIVSPHTWDSATWRHRANRCCVLGEHPSPSLHPPFLPSLLPCLRVPPASFYFLPRNSQTTSLSLISPYTHFRHLCSSRSGGKTVQETKRRNAGGNKDMLDELRTRLWGVQRELELGVW